MRDAREVIARALAIAQRPTPAKGFDAYDVLRSWADADPKEHPNHHPDNIPHLRREWKKLHADTDAILAALAAAGLAVVPLCACPQRAEVAAAAREHGPNSAARWRLCGEPRCPAVEEAGDA